MVENVPVTAFFSYSARVIQQCIMSFFFLESSKSLKSSKFSLVRNETANQIRVIMTDEDLEQQSLCPKESL